MPTDQLVDARIILEAMGELKRRGIDAILQDLEATEPDLANFILEDFSQLHGRLCKTGASAKQIKSLQRQIQTIVVVSILSMRLAHRRLWERQMEGTPLSQLAASEDPDSPPATPAPGESP